MKEPKSAAAYYRLQSSEEFDLSIEKCTVGTMRLEKYFAMQRDTDAMMKRNSMLEFCG